MFISVKTKSGDAFIRKKIDFRNNGWFIYLYIFTHLTKTPKLTKVRDYMKRKC